MQVRLSFSFLLFSALLLFASPAFSAGDSAPSGEGVSPRCEAAIDKAAGNYSRCLLKATAMYGKQGQRGKKFLAKQERCEINFNRRVSLAQDRYGEDQCTPYVSAIADRTKTYASKAAAEAHGLPMASVLFVQNGTGGTLSEDTLTLTGVSSQTGWFTDRPYRKAGQVPTQEFLSNWDEGDNPFSEDPPNADFTCTVEGEVVNFIVELSSPRMTEADFVYAAKHVGDPFVVDETITCEADSHLFIDDDSCAAWSDGLTSCF